MRDPLSWYDSVEAWERSPIVHRVVQVFAWAVSMVVGAAIIVFLAVGAWEYLNHDANRIELFGGGGDQTCFQTPDGFEC